MGERRAGDVFARSRRVPGGDRVITLPTGVGGNSEYLLTAGEEVDDFNVASDGGWDIVGVVCRRGRPAELCSSSNSVEARRKVCARRFSSVLLRRASREDVEGGRFRKLAPSVSSLGREALR
jgi:hypothetical protein